MSETRSVFKKVSDGILTWIGPAIILAFIWLGNFMINLKNDVKVVHDIKETVDKMDEDSNALWGTASEQKAEIERLKATIGILEKLVINPAHRVGLVDENELPKNKNLDEKDINHYMMEQRTKYPAPAKE